MKIENAGWNEDSLKQIKEHMKTSEKRKRNIYLWTRCDLKAILV